MTKINLSCEIRSIDSLISDLIGPREWKHNSSSKENLPTLACFMEFICIHHMSRIVSDIRRVIVLSGWTFSGFYVLFQARIQFRSLCGSANQYAPLMCFRLSVADSPHVELGPKVTSGTTGRRARNSLQNSLGSQTKCRTDTKESG